jgi:hypothetical protein
MSTPLYHTPPPAGSPADGQLPLFDDAPDPRAATWRGFTLDTSEDDAAAAFLRRYGQLPRFVFENLGLLLVGPVPGQER